MTLHPVRTCSCQRDCENEADTHLIVRNALRSLFGTLASLVLRCSRPPAALQDANRDVTVADAECRLLLLKVITGRREFLT